MIRMAVIAAALMAVGFARAYDAKQVRRAETDADECRKSDAHYRTKHADDPRLMDLLIERRCSLYDEVPKEKRKAYEDRKRRERERVAEDARG
ncbi:MAG: hypothetical protein ABUJ93_10230 [Hyphomicrobium sp.]